MDVCSNGADRQGGAPKPTVGGYYGPIAYRLDSVPDQPTQQQDFNHSTLRRSASFRLPWGGAQDVMPVNLFSRWSPKILRDIEQVGNLLAGTGHEGQQDHECIRYAPLAFRSRVIDMCGALGKGLFWVGLILGLVTYLMHAYLTHSTLLAALLEVWPFLLVLTGVPAFMWLSSILVFKLFPRWCVKAGRGPLWEINRRTGMVRVWRYARKISLLGRREATIIEAPFYEFDGWVIGGATQYGPRFDFVLCHRYSKLEVHLGDILLGWHHTSRPCYAFWDFLQNYMDVTRPLPEFPVLEPHRHKDPVTAEHDRKTRRPARYWRDMSDQMFTKHEDEM
ncbi:hypothetical protein SAMN04487960_1211, partial [Marinobacter mobilis]